ncbi:cortical protein marker for cell polarity-domain-containing protein [Aspergillus cavernicola]|uniref:Cortical protein marker for cell polarity-domain-containing protein n=1 Tax=Aspergillus cavernicola TaxID=176166 RepID=A0ABR4IC43_9EURO
MRFPSLFGPATAGSSTVLQFWLLSQLSCVSALSFQPVSQPELDLSRLGQVALTGDFDAVTFYSYAEQSNTHAADDDSQSILAPLPNGILTALTTSDADIRAMCTLSEQDGANSGIFVGGNFTSLGGIEAQGVALYDPNSNNVTAMPGLSGSVSALLCDRETNSVYVGGTFKQGNTSNAVAWVRGEGWKRLSFDGFNGPVTSIVKDDDGHIIFGGSFDGIGNSTSSKKTKQQVINLSNATITSDTQSTRSGLTDPQNIICQTSGAGGEGETWLLADYALGYWRADMRFNFNPTKLRLYNTHFEGRGTKTFLFRRLPDNGIMNLTYTDPNTGDNVNCDQSCSLSDDSEEEYRDFRFVNNVGMSGFQLEVKEWYGTGAGLNGIELFTNDIFTYAINDFNEPTCGDNSDSSTSSQTGSWAVTESDESPSDYLTAQVSNSDATSTSVVFEPNIEQSGNYSILVYTPGCEQDGTCDTRGIVNVTATVRSESDSAEPIETQIYQTNIYEKYDTIYSGPVDASGDSFRPSVTLAAIPGQGDNTLVASRVKFELRSASNSTSGELNGLYEYDPASKNVSTNLLESTINKAATQLDLSASIRSLVNHAGIIYAAGNFSNSDIDNIFSLESDANATAMPQGGLNSEVATMDILNSKLYVGGNFTGTSSGAIENLNYVASYSVDSQSWSTLGGGVNGPVKRVIALPMNISSDLNETIIAVSGDFDQLLAFDENPAVAVSGFAAWGPSRNNWVQNLNVTQTQFSGQLSAFAKSNGTTILSGSLVSGGTAAGGAVALLHDDELQLDPLLSSAQSSGETVTGMYDINSDRNLTILGGHFNVTTSDGSTIRNLALLNGDNGTITGLGTEVDHNSTFMALAIASNILYAGGKVTGTVGDSELNGLVLYDLQNRTIAQEQPPKFNGDDVSVKSIVPRPDSTEIYVGGQFSTAGSLPCSGVCYYDTETQQWNRPGVELEGSVLALKWAKSNTLVAIGNLTVAGNQTAVASYSTNDKAWEVFEGASASSIPGTVTAFTPASGDLSRFWLAGQSENGSSFVVNYDSSTFYPSQEIFGDGTVILGLDVLPLASDHDDSDLLDNDLALLVTGQIVVPDFGNASAALFNGTTLMPFILSSTSDGQLGRMSHMFYENSNPYARENGHRSNGIVVLVAFCCALGCVFLIVIAGVIFNKIQRRRQGYMAAPQAAGTDRPTSMRRLPPEYLFNSLKQPNPGAPAL